MTEIKKAAQFRMMDRSERVPGFGERLKAALDEAGGVARAAADLGIQYNTLLKWTREENVPTIWALCALSVYLRTTPDKLLGIDPVPGKEARRLGIWKDHELWGRRRKEYTREQTRARAAEREAREAGE